MTTMPFGKYRDCDRGEIPTNYLKWLLTIDLFDELRDAVEEELDLRRAGYTRPRQEWPTIGFDVAGWYRALSLRFHPDRPGGSKEAMQAVNAAKELLEEMTA